MGISSYDEVATLDTQQLTKQLLEKVVSSLAIQKDTSTKKVTRLTELDRAGRICSVFIQHINDNIPVDERTIYLSIFTGIADKILDATRGQNVSFDDAISALKFILTNIKEY